MRFNEHASSSFIIKDEYTTQIIYVKRIKVYNSALDTAVAPLTPLFYGRETRWMSSPFESDTQPRPLFRGTGDLSRPMTVRPGFAKWCCFRKILVWRFLLDRSAS